MSEGGERGNKRVRVSPTKGGGLKIRMNLDFERAHPDARAAPPPAKPTPAVTPPPPPTRIPRFEPAEEPVGLISAEPESGVAEHRRLVYDRLGKDFLGVCWPAEGPLGEYASYISLTTDAHPLYHLAAILPMFAHEATIRQFRPVPDVAPFFKVQVILVGRSASSKSTAFSRSHKFYAEYRGRVHTETEGAVIRFEGTPQGLFEALADALVGQPPRVHAMVMHHDEVSNVLSKKKQADSIQELLCQLFDAEQPLERHQRGIKRHNRTSAVKELERITTYATSAQFATTPSGLGLISSPILLSGGLLNRMIWAVVPDDEVVHTVRSYLARYAAEREAALDEWEGWGAWAEATLFSRADAAAQPWITVACDEKLDRLLEATLLKKLREEIDDVMQSFWKRGLVVTRMVASLFALNDRRLAVTEDDLLLAIAFMERMLAGFQHGAYPTLITHSPPTFAEAQARVLLGIKKAGQTGVIRRELYTFVPHFRKRELDEVIERLLDEERIEIITVIGGGSRYRWKR